MRGSATRAPSSKRNYFRAPCFFEATLCSRVMTALHESLRRQLEKAVVQARDVAEQGARAALARLAVGEAKPFAGLSEAEKELRNRLRARGRQIGDTRLAAGEQAITRLAGELAYEYWHRMLFARFLAENDLLMHPDGVSVSLAD